MMGVAVFIVVHPRCPPQCKVSGTSFKIELGSYRFKIYLVVRVY